MCVGMGRPQEGKLPIVSLYSGVGGLDLAFSEQEAQKHPSVRQCLEHMKPLFGAKSALIITVASHHFAVECHRIELSLFV